MKEKDNNLMKWLSAALLLMATMMMSCGGGYLTPPEPSGEEKATEWLCNILMSDSGRVMTGRQLATQHEERSMFDVALPFNEDDVQPRMATYCDSTSGGTITFRPIEASIDTIQPIAVADLRIVWHGWADSTCLPDSTETYRVRNRGNGILSCYRVVHDFGPNGGKHRCYDKHPDGYPEYLGMLLYVYPGADSLLYSCGYKESHRVYKIEKLKE